MKKKNNYGGLKTSTMPTKLSTLVSKIQNIPNQYNSQVVYEFYQFMKENGASEKHITNELHTMLYFTTFLGPDSCLLDINRREQVIAFLNTKQKDETTDPGKRWITTWNDYLGTIKHFFRWLYNQRGKEELIPTSEWNTPQFVQIKKKNTKRLSPYSQTDIWDRDELLTIIKYQPYLRNKAALTLFWDLDARNHEVTMLKIKNVRLRDKYGEGEVPYEAKTGSGPMLLTCSFPYIRDWLNEHPFRNNPEARLICNLHNGAPVKPESMWSMMKQLRGRIARLLDKGEITDPKEREILEFLLRTKKWNPYCIRHSAITYDSDSLPEFALKKKVRWSMNSKQPARYIKRRMGNNLKMQILQREGIELDDGSAKPKPAIMSCPRCSETNPRENKFCSKCSYPLIPEAYDEVKASERKEMDEIKQQYNQMNVTLQNIVAIMVTADESTKKKLAKQLIERGGYTPKEGHSNLV
jgi:integrase/recombinase XerD